MKHLYAFIAAALIAIAIILVLTKQPAEAPLEDAVACTMDARICPDGSAVGRIGPDCSFAPCPILPEQTDERIELSSPQAGDTITSPVTLTGKARGQWFFEASFPITVVNWDGLIIGEGYATADGDWMTTDFVPFTATISYTIDPETPYNRGTLILKKDNPSGLPEHDAAIEVPVVFGELNQ